MDSQSSESIKILNAVRGCDLPSAVLKLHGMRWSVRSAFQKTRTIFVVTACNSRQQIQMYGKNGRICTVNFGRKSDQRDLCLEGQARPDAF